jgi:hypothetical protein
VAEGKPVGKAQSSFVFACYGGAKVTPIEKKYKSPYQKLLCTILEKELSAVRDSFES